MSRARRLQGMSDLASGRPRPASCGERAGVNPRLRGKPATPRLVAPIRHLHLNRNPNLNRILDPILNLYLTRSHTIDRLNQPSEQAKWRCRVGVVRTCYGR